MKKKILFIAPHLSTGGLPQYLFKKIELIKDEFDVFLIEWNDITGGRLVVQKNKLLELLDENKFITLRENKHELIDIINSIKPDIIHLEEIPEYFMDDDIARSIYRTDRDYFIVETSHDSSMNTNNKLFFPDKFMFVSNWQIEQYKNIDVPKVLVEYPIEYIDRPDRYYALKKLNLDPSKKHILHIGLFTPRKNQKEFFEYAKALPEYEFHCVGNQADNFKWYWEPLMEDKPSNVTWWNERTDVDSFYQSMDLFLFTSRGTNNDKETMPLVIREALSYQIPQLLYNLEVYQNYFDDYSSINYLDFDDFEENVQKIKNMIKGFKTTETQSQPKFKIWYEPSAQKIHTQYMGDENISEFRIVIRDIDSKVTMWKYITPHKSAWCVPIPKTVHDYEQDPNVGGFLVEIFDNTTNTLLYFENIRVKYPTLYKPQIHTSEEPGFINYTQFFVDKIFQDLPISSPKTVLDIGASIGLWTEWVLQQNAHQVYAFEPNKNALKDLHKLHGHNDRVTIIDKAIYKDNTQLDLHCSNENSLVSSLHPHDGSGFIGNSNISSYKVDTITLETFIKEHNVKHIDLVKIDIEGGEFDIIPNLKQSTFDIIDSFLIEIHWQIVEDGEAKLKELKDTLYNQGYNINQFMDDTIYFSKFKG